MVVSKRLPAARAAIVGAALLSACGILSPAPAAAFDFYWNKTTGNYSAGANWDEQIVGNPAGRLPDAANQEIASIINGGTATVSSTIAPNPGGIRLGSGPQNILTGTGTLSVTAGGNLTTATSAGDANGNIVVGEAINNVNGEGSLLMTGGTLTTPTAVTLGGAATSTIRLSGASTLNMATATLGRDFRITGPSVNFNATGAVTFQAGGGAGRYTAEITHATLNSAIKTPANVGLAGQLSVAFNGVTPVPGNTWNLIDAGSITGSFANAPLGANVPVTGATAPVGSAFRLKSTTGAGVNARQLQVTLEKILVLSVDRTSGIMTLRNPLGAAVTQLTGYQIDSPRAALLASYKGISGAPAGNSGWEKAPTNSATGLAEFKPSGVFDVSTVGTSVSLGQGFDKNAGLTALGVGGLGTINENLAFTYTTFGGAVAIGQVEYTGAAFYNDMILNVSSTGVATLKNDSTIPLSIDGYSIVSSTNSLSGASWASLQGRPEARFDGWQETPAFAGALSETNSLETNPLTIAPGESFPLGDIGNFATAGEQAGLQLKYILTNEDSFRLGQVKFSVGLSGDFDGDGNVDGDDFLRWQRGGSPNPNSSSDLAIWRANYGQVASTAAAAAVPEPHGLILLLLGAASVGVVQRRRA